MDNSPVLREDFVRNMFNYNQLDLAFVHTESGWDENLKPMTEVTT